MVFNILNYEELESSNTEAIKLALSGSNEGTVVVCKKQTAGRGQRNNKWESNGENLTASLILRTKIDAANLFMLSKAFSVSIIKTLKTYNINAVIKWPNDIYVNEKKIAGILIEHSFVGNNLKFSIVGLGLNTKQTSFSQMNIIPTSIVLENPLFTINNNDILSNILNNFAELYTNLQNNFTSINAEYMNNLYRKNGFFMYKDNHKNEFEAEIIEVQNSGELILRGKNGNLNSFLFKEIMYI